MPEDRKKPTGVLTSNSLPPFTVPAKSGDSTERRATRARSQHGHDPASLRRNTNGNHREHLHSPNTFCPSHWAFQRRPIAYANVLRESPRFSENGRSVPLKEVNSKGTEIRRCYEESRCHCTKLYSTKARRSIAMVILVPRISIGDTGPIRDCPDRRFPARSQWTHVTRLTQRPVVE